MRKALKVEKGSNFSRTNEIKTILRELRNTPNLTKNKSPFEVNFGTKTNTELRIITNPVSSKNLNRYDFSDPESIVNLTKIVVYDDEDSTVPESKNKRQQTEEAKQEVEDVRSDTDESDHMPLVHKRQQKTPNNIRMRLQNTTPEQTQESG